MLDGIFKLLKLEMAFAVAVIGLGFKLATWLVRLVSRQFDKPLLQPQVPQLPVPPISTPPAPIVIQTSPPAARPEPRTPPPQPATPRPLTPSAVLANPDHAIYLTTGSDFIMQHPRSTELLERLDYMMYVAAHRDGDPFTIPPALDDSVPAGVPGLRPLTEDDGFDQVPPKSLPAPDGRLWLARPGQAFTPLDAVRP